MYILKTPTSIFHMFRLIQNEIKIVWAIITFFILVLFISLFYFKGTSILTYTPTCYSVKMYNKECSLCGMTRAFVKISELKFYEAYKLNNGSIALFSIMIFNCFLFVLFFILKNNHFFKPKILNYEDS